jgi:pyrimidine-specific ribonucleoside hydrolase
MNPHRTLVSFLTALVFLAACSAPEATPVRTAPTLPAGERRAIVIDTDMAPDDWMAILYLLQRPDVTVRAITVSGTGETHCAPGIRHALGLAALAGGGQLPVGCGRETPLEGDHAFPESWRTGVDDLLGLSLPEGSAGGATPTAVELLSSEIKSSPGKLTLLTLGPLTNVAEALQADPSLVDDIGMIYIMGGAVDTPGNVGASGVGIQNERAEWNIYVDPVAADIVFRSGAPITLVPLDATNQVPLTSEFYDQVRRNHGSDEAGFVYDVLTQQKGFIDSGGYFFWDPLAAAVMTDESLATIRDENLCVVRTEGPETGWTKPGDGCPRVRVAVSADEARFRQTFLDTLNSAAP